MRVHQNQMNPNAQLDAMYAAQKAAARREAERTGKKLLEFGRLVTGEGDSERVMQSDPREQSEHEDDQERPQKDNDLSDWG